MELGAVVVANKPGELLKMLRLKLDDRGRAEAVRLLAAGDEGLAKQTADRFPSEEPKISGAGREAEKFFRIGCAQPLKVGRKPGAVEIFTDGCRGK